ncbi:MAG: pyruvate kinase [Candidatus Aenigmarchaeota archaeon]|nr:pyruvate kinase [Candidatus Aenigmarchaeota archaeon]
MKKTKIVATIGPSSEPPEMIKKLIEAGLNVARLNFSHGGFDEQGPRIKNFRAIDPSIGIMLDTQGPELRTLQFEIPDHEYPIKEGDILTIKFEDVLGNEKQFSMNYKDFYKDAKPGDRVLIDNARIEIRVVEVQGKDVICKVMNNGVIYSKRSINLPDSQVRLPSMSEKDRGDIKFGVERGIDFIAYSFVRNIEDVQKLRDYLKELNAEHVEVISKIETSQAIENLEEIVKVSDGIMVARGDLAVEVAMEKVPILQKKMIELANKHHKFCIVATEMLESMRKNPRPTRAEISDVANAVFQGADATMLSGETTLGKYPLETVSTMAKIAKEAEISDIEHCTLCKDPRCLADCIARNFVSMSNELKLKTLIVPTKTGLSAKVVSRYRPRAKVFALVPNEIILRKMSLLYGVEGVLADHSKTMFDLIQEGVTKLVTSGKIDPKEKIGIIGEYKEATTNAMMFVEAEKLLTRNSKK